MFNKNKENSKNNESKDDRFKRIAGRRVNEILYKLKLLGNCSNKSVYSYTETDKKKIFSIIDSELRRIKALFDNPNRKGEEFRL